MRRLGLIAGLATVGVAVATYGVLDAHDVVPGVLTMDPDPAAIASPAASGPGSAAHRVALPRPAASPSPASAPLPAPARLAAQLAPALRDPRLGTGVSMVVRDGTTGAHLLDLAADTPRTPASTTKLLTAAAVLHALRPDARLTTSTTLSPDGTVHLVAGGDMMLGRGASQPGAVEGHAGLATLADETAAALRRAGRTSVRLSLDLGYAAGPDYAPTWPRGLFAEGVVGKVAMLGFADGLVEPGHPGPADPPGEVGQALARALQARGVTVQGPVGRTPSAAGATPLARVESAPVVDVLADALGRSDNALTEGLARQASLAASGGRGTTTFASTAAWVRAVLEGQEHADLRGVQLRDVSGLSAGTTVPARAIGDVLGRAVAGTDPAMSRLVAALPVAGLTGTLSGRYVSGPSASAAGLVRAKTGTLTGTSSLGGTVVDADGRTLVFVVIANGVPASSGTDGARAALDAVAARLASCGCR